MNGKLNNGRPMISNASLVGKKVLVIEDEMLISMFIEDTLADIGCETVGIIISLAEAMEKVSQYQCDVIMLDVNLGGEQTFELAELLCERKQPLIFCTGYGVAGVPIHLQHVPVLQKPFQESDLSEKLQIALSAIWP